MLLRFPRMPNLPPRETPNCFRNSTFLVELSLKFSGWCNLCFILQEKKLLYLFFETWKKKHTDNIKKITLSRACQNNNLDSPSTTVMIPEIMLYAAK